MDLGFRKMSKENLENLVSGFYDADEAANVIEDIRIGDEIIASGDKVSADPAVLNSIKCDISKHLKSRQGRRMHMNSLRTAVAAMILIAVFVGMRGFVHQGPEFASNFKWFWGEDAKASSMSIELEEIHDRIISVGQEDAQYETDMLGNDLDQIFIDDNGGFWR